MQPIAEGSLESENDSKKVLHQIQTASRDIAGFWANQKLSDPRSYRLSRVAAWMVVENVPPANEGVTQVLPPAAERLKFFDAKMEKSEFAVVLAELEKTIARAPFCLDGHFMVVKALRALGAEYEPAQQPDYQ
ncbi:MAG: type VI secretion system domain-containing protein [Gammaproteobacteria bacterium]|nr:type VI secretion system domain-containing protein [Gammaproteobacteria bacterium]MBL6998497.1 type VI secretion system domain-containing protein [Gammaproteobacteria bacterium]